MIHYSFTHTKKKKKMVSLKVGFFLVFLIKVLRSISKICFFKRRFFYSSFWANLAWVS